METVALGGVQINYYISFYNKMCGQENFLVVRSILPTDSLYCI
jgi:hypothetical protein